MRNLTKAAKLPVMGMTSGFLTFPLGSEYPREQKAVSQSESKAEEKIKKAVNWVTSRTQINICCG